MKYNKILKNLLVTFTILSVFAACAGGARRSQAAQGNAADPIPFMERARVGTLPSGMRYYLLENPQPEGRVFLTLAVNAGSVLEQEHERGLAHFVEHMAFRGTSRFPDAEIVNYLRSLGMRFGPDINAWVSFDETVYRIEVPTEIAPNGRRVVPYRALMVMDDWSRNITFDPQDVEDERLVIIEEYRFRLGARDRVNRQIFPVILRGSPYAYRLPIGALEVIETATVEDLRGFFEKWYRPENMAIIVVGDFDAEYLQATLSEHFPAAPSTEPFYRPRFNLSEPERDSLISLVLTDDELTTSRVDLYWKRQGEPRRNDLASFRSSIIDNLAHTMLALRFEEAGMRPETPFVWAGAGMSNFGYSSRYYILAAQPKTSSITPTLRELLLTQQSLYRYGFLREELEVAQSFLVSRMEQTVSEVGRRHSNTYVRAFTRHFIQGEVIAEPAWELNTINALLPGITIEEINRAVRGYFADNDLTVFITAPEAEAGSLPTDDEIRAIVAESRAAVIARPVAFSVQEHLLPYTPQGGHIVSESIDSETGAIRIVLNNGAEVILKETANRNNEIVFYALARGGTFSVPEAASVSASLAAEMLSVSGLGPFNRSELIRMLSGQQVSMSFWTQNQLRGFQGSSTIQDTRTLFQMLYLAFTQPRIDPDAVSIMLAQRRSSLAFQENDPSVVFHHEITRTTFGNSRFHPTVVEDLDRVNIQDAMAFIARTLNPADYVFVFTGNLSLPMMRPFLETYLASIPRAASFNEWADISPARPAFTVERDIHRGREERSTVYLGWFRSHDHSEEENAVVAGLNEYLRIQLNDRIREDLGGVYAISSWVSLTPFHNGELSGGVFFNCDPARAEELTAAVVEVFRNVAAGRINQAVLSSAIEALVQAHDQSIQSNLHIAQSYANSVMIFDSPLSRLTARPALFRTVTSADVQKAAARLLDGPHVRLFLFPEE